MLAALDNIREHALEHELEDIGRSMTDDQRFFLRKIADFGGRVTDAEIEAENNCLRSPRTVDRLWLTNTWQNHAVNGSR